MNKNMYTYIKQGRTSAFSCYYPASWLLSTVWQLTDNMEKTVIQRTSQGENEQNGSPRASPIFCHF